MYCVPRVAVSLRASVDYACGVEQLGIDALVALAGAQPARKVALGGAPVDGAVVFQLVE